MPAKKYFLSYAREDLLLLQKIVDSLDSHNVDDWFDMLDIPIGADWDDEIQHALKSSEAVIFFASPISVASRNVKNELSYADELNKAILPIIIKECELPFRYKRKQYIDLTQEYEGQLARLIKVLGGRKPGNMTVMEDDPIIQKKPSEGLEVTRCEYVIEEEALVPKTEESDIIAKIDGPQPDTAFPWEADDEPKRISLWSLRNILIGSGIMSVVILAVAFFSTKNQQAHENKGSSIDSAAVVKNSEAKDSVVSNSTPGISDQNSNDKESVSDDNIFQKVEIEAKFPGGEGAWANYITREINRYADTLAVIGVAGTCVVQFIVNVDGAISEVEALTLQGTLFAKICTNAVKKGPRWVPAEHNGRKVKAYRKQPVTFQIEQGEVADTLKK